MGTRKIVREFRRKAKSAGYCVGAITSDSGHLHAIVMHGTTPQRITLPLVTGQSRTEHQARSG